MSFLSFPCLLFHCQLSLYGVVGSLQAGIFSLQLCMYYWIKKGLSSLTLKPNGINQYPATFHCTCPWISSDSLQCLYDMVIILLFCPKYLRQNEPVPQPASVESKKVWMLHMSWDISWRNIGLFEGIWAAEVVLKHSVDGGIVDLSTLLTKKDPWKVIIVSHCSKHPTDLDNWQKLICQPYLI